MRKRFNYKILDADGHIIAGGRYRLIKDIHDTFNDMKPTAKVCIVTRKKYSGIIR